MTTTTPEATETAARSYFLSPAEYTLTVEKIGKVNDRAVKKGFAGTLQVAAERVERRYLVDPLTGDKWMDWQRDSAPKHCYPLVEVGYKTRITGEAPSYGGWTFLALLDFDQHAGLIVRTAPGIESVDREGLTEGTCGHCKVKRARRKTMLVRNDETGEQMQVGTTCIKDFLGWNANPVFLWDDAATKEVDEILGGGYGTHEPSYTVDTVLQVAVAAIRAFGFVPASSYDGQPTRDVVSLVMRGAKYKGEKETVEAVLARMDGALAKAAEVRAFILSDEFSGASEYVTNLKAVAAAEHVSSRNYGLLASAPQALAKAQERSLVRQREADLIKDEWVGEVGGKVEITGTIKKISWVPDTYSYSGGSKPVYKILSADGHLFTWFASSEVLGEEEGVKVTIKGTIKKHDEYKGTKSTVLTRCKKVD